MEKLVKLNMINVVLLEGYVSDMVFTAAPRPHIKFKLTHLCLSKQAELYDAVIMCSASGKSAAEIKNFVVDGDLVLVEGKLSMKENKTIKIKITHVQHTTPILKKIEL